jgi:nitrate/nitrite-specific signal transduction histidine kinase
MRRRAGIVTAASVVLTFALASMAFAVETTRTEYTEAVEPICKENSDANKRILAGVRTEVKQGRFKAAAAKFAKAAAALGKTYRELEAVPKPTADATRLSKWLSYVKVEVELLQKTSKALKAGQANRARTFVAKLTYNANLANSQIAIFDFHSCVFKPSQYT